MFLCIHVHMIEIMHEENTKDTYYFGGLFTVWSRSLLPPHGNLYEVN